MTSEPAQMRVASPSMARNSTRGFRAACSQTVSADSSRPYSQTRLSVSSLRTTEWSVDLHACPILTVLTPSFQIVITRCANRTAGRWCCAFLILFGIIGKISGVFLASKSTPGLLLASLLTFVASPEPGARRSDDILVCNRHYQRHQGFVSHQSA